jgi:hypothetical protein
VIKYQSKFFGRLNGAKALNTTFFLHGHLEFGNQQNFQKIHLLLLLQESLTLMTLSMVSGQ